MLFKLGGSVLTIFTIRPPQLRRGLQLQVEWAASRTNVSDLMEQKYFSDPLMENKEKEIFVIFFPLLVYILQFCHIS